MAAIQTGGRSRLLEMVWLAKTGNLSSWWYAEYGETVPASAWKLMLETLSLTGEPRVAVEYGRLLGSGSARDAKDADAE